MSFAPGELPAQFAQQNLNIDRIEGADSWSAKRYNVGPQCIEPVYFFNVEHESTKPLLRYMKWGVTPKWASQKSQKLSTFNARYENIEHSKIWSHCLDHRCVIPVEGYFEWKTDSSKNKQPWFIRRKDQKLMFLAGLYSITSDGNYEYTIITREAPKQLEWLHSRMPVVLEPGTDEFNSWLGLEDSNWGKLRKLLKVHEKEDLEWYKVKKEVGNVKNDGEDLVKPIKEESLQGFFRKEETKPIKSELTASIKDEEKKDSASPETFKLSHQEPVTKKEGRNINDFPAKRRKSSSSPTSPSKKQHTITDFLHKK
ncbi:hypothetical protein KL906_002085 [Ogataea polymorpha]|nr:hypothetical protein KL937_004917 [Ogataea polymorpha]KAG7910180.1 hypothetical protein KL906_002085 [Ogataea polymorpha]KAG7931815.1 hypothetical protein KL904_004856 [Ogataea polymorpha]